MYDIENFYQRTVALLASQFQKSNIDGSLTNFQKLIAAICTQFTEINTVELQLYSQRWLSTALGIQLDGIGSILGINRIPGQSDDSYREDLYFQIFVNSSSGTPEEMIFALAYLTKGTLVHLDEPYPAFYEMSTNGDVSNFPVPPGLIVQEMYDISPAGVSWPPIFTYFGGTPLFVFSSDPFAEDFYVAPNPNDFTELHPLEVTPDGSILYQLQVNRGQVNETQGGGFAEDNYTIEGAGHLVEVLVLNGNIAPGQ